jgi:hypothetical protein
MTGGPDGRRAARHRPRVTFGTPGLPGSALVLSDAGLGRLCRDDPPTGLAVLRALGRDAAAKAREQRRHLVHQPAQHQAAGPTFI